MRNRIVHVASVLLLFTLQYLSINSAVAAERIIHNEFDVDEEVAFHIKSHRGHIEVQTADVNKITIITTITHPDEEALEEVEIKSRVSGNKVRFTAEFNSFESDSGFWWNIFSWNIFSNTYSEYPHIQYSIILPRSAELNIDSHRSTMNIEAPGGEVNIESHRGSGTITGIHSDFSLDTHRGDFELEVDELNDLRVKSHRGNIDADISNASNYRLEGESHRGRLEFSGANIDVNEVRHEYYVSEEFGTGEHRIDIASHRGDIHFNFSN